MLKSLIALSIIVFIISVLFLVLRHHATVLPTSSHVLYIDDIQKANKDATDEFETAFALDSMCNGLRLARFTKLDSRPTEHLEVLKNPVWSVQFYKVVDAGDSTEGKYVLTMYPVNFKGISVFNLPPMTVEKAAHNACFVAQGKGGRE
jgi:hypothetical protein